MTSWQLILAAIGRIVDAGESIERTKAVSPPARCRWTCSAACKRRSSAAQGVAMEAAQRQVTHEHRLDAVGARYRLGSKTERSSVLDDTALPCVTLWTHCGRCPTAFAPAVFAAGIRSASQSMPWPPSTC